MALAVQITNNSATTYNLQAEKAIISYERNPIQIALPTSGAPTDPILIELGFFKPKIILENVIVDDTSSLDGAVTIPSKQQLEDFVNGTASDTLWLTIASHRYVVKILNCTFERMGGRDNRWFVRMQFVSSSRSAPAFVDPP